MKKFKETFLCEFLKSTPFIAFVVVAILILGGITISNCNRHKNVVQMEEDVLYIRPKSDTSNRK
jgi:hypothetical protein